MFFRNLAIVVTLFLTSNAPLVVAVEPIRARSLSPRIERTGGVTLKTETFDRDPGWEGINNRSAQMREPIKIRQDFGYSESTSNAGGRGAGEMGGYITPAGEAAFYGKVIAATDFEKPLSASGMLSIESRVLSSG